MKNHIIYVFSFILLLCSLSSYAQSTKGFNYQAVARDSDGGIIYETPVIISFRIREDNASGRIIFQEAHNETTNSLGLVQMVIGKGTPEIGDFKTISWNEGDYYLEVQLNGATVDTKLLEGVPYAKVATAMKLSDLNDVASINPRTNQILKWDGSQWIAADETQTIYTSGTGINITGNTISNTAPDQEITLNGSGATSVIGTYPNYTISSTDNVNDADASTTNEIQSMALSGNTLSLSLGGGSVSLASFSSPWNNSGSNLYFNTGKVGIGDNSPVATLTVGNGDKLQIHGSDGDIVFKDDQGSLRFANSNGSNAPMIHMFQSGTNNSTRMLVAHSPNFSSWGIQYNDTADAFNWIGDNEPVMQVQLSGQQRVGLGTFSPQAKFHVNVDSRVGIGHLKLTEEGFDYSRITMNNTIHNTFWDLAARTDTNLANAQFNIYHKDVGDILSVNARRRVGINDATPAYPLEVNGNGQLRTINVYNTLPAATGNIFGYGVRSVLSQGSTTGNPRIYCLFGRITDDDSYLSFGVYGRAESASNFNYGVYGVSNVNDGYAGYFSGNTFTSNTYQTSDGKFKTNIKAVEDGVKTIMALQPKTYTYDTQQFDFMNLPEGVQYGFVAQDIETLLPNLVRRAFQPYEESKVEKFSKQGMEFKALNYVGLIPIIVSAIQGQQKTIQQQEERIQSLEERLARLEAKINE